MKKFKSSEDLDFPSEKGVAGDRGRREEDMNPQRSSSSMHRSSYYKCSRYDRADDDRESSRLVSRKRSNYDLDSYDRRKNYEHQRGVNERPNFTSSPRSLYGADRIHRSESYSGPRRDFPKGFRSERDRPRRENITTSWRRFGGGKESDDGTKSGNESSRGSKMDSEDDVVGVKSPKGLRDVKSSPDLSESESEQSKRVDDMKCEDNYTMLESKSSVPSCEREEGEFEPDPQPCSNLAEPIVKDRSELELASAQRELKCEDYPLEPNKVLEDIVTLSSVEKGDESKDKSSMKLEGSGLLSKGIGDLLNADNELQKCRDVRAAEEGVGRKVVEEDTIGKEEGMTKVFKGRRESSVEEDEEGTSQDKLSPLRVQEDHGDNIIEMNAEEYLKLKNNVEAAERNEVPLTDQMTRNLIEEEKCSAVLPYNRPNHIGISDVGVENKSNDAVRCENLEIEEPSAIGFQFFSTDPVKKRAEQSTLNKPKDDKLALELSLSLPNVLLPIGASQVLAPGSPSHGGSIQSFASSFRTNSDGFTASMSFSGSQRLTHNPSCSMNHDAYDNEKSVGSKPLFKGVDWKALASDENKSKDETAYPLTSSRENGPNIHSQLSDVISSGLDHTWNIAGTNSSKISSSLERQLSVNKQTSGSHGFVSYRNGSEKWQLTAEKDSSSNSLQTNNYYPHGNGQDLVTGSDISESIVTMIVSEPLHVMTRKFSGMTPQHTTLVKDFVHSIISNRSKQLSTLQKALLCKRPDITLNTLVSLHRVQLEVLVALKTGVRDFVSPKLEIPSSDLAEIFLEMRCKNPSCRSPLPVDECNCNICRRQNDFCRECMCLVCSKFDNASNTCSWVGCDVCLHWCHTDCGLRESHIRNGLNAEGVQGTSEIQFYCVACDHPSEMFGFVKDVFRNFVRIWSLENLSRELEYVRRIFCASDDLRGKKLHEFAVSTLSRLGGGVELEELKNHVMSFFKENESDKPNTIVIEPRNKLPPTRHKDNDHIVGFSREWKKPIDKSTNPINTIPKFDIYIDEKYTANIDFRRTARREQQPMFDELESIVRIKQAEAQMFQSRADDARKESEDLKRISISKSIRVEEEYRSRISKLRLSKAEEMRKQKIKELQAVERVYQEYFNMKMRMETEIKDLLTKMEATRRNLTI